MRPFSLKHTAYIIKLIIISVIFSFETACMPSIVATHKDPLL